MKKALLQQDKKTLEEKTKEQESIKTNQMIDEVYFKNSGKQHPEIRTEARKKWFEENDRLGLEKITCPLFEKEHILRKEGKLYEETDVKVADRKKLIRN